MTSLSTTNSELIPAPADTHPISRETVSSLAVLAVVLAALVWGSIAQLRSNPLAGQAGQEAEALLFVD
jgi:hypothetical protein